ncbi:hypothetical protein IMG5_155050 [Ichthyophthirius multifiliis]|uniref:Calpain catalytic domain-containing protein n=1 Tax=Ichthyophthirius multifiliis TaxID=5932 RepID=G0QZ80_ICHMU|nr:hypothetical protein IMG5_155050 [Ichthyophthirius multifiliis]EGR29463.1 hypothetical protein IMG5_155050 [Ichthyophthirius multifiliis]|eukprot:XP_004030699.1 hypothetical protein IMG5_155050 [Ichthyophthirius multifiliis]
MYSSYQDLHGGFTNNCLTDLTGAPSEQIEEGEFQAWGVNIDSWLKRGFLVYVENNKNLQSQNILYNSGYSFAILDIYDIISINTTLVKLRSPIKNLIYEDGEWNSKSQKWTEQIKQQINYEQSSQIFYMSLQELRNNFEYLGNCRTHENYKFNIKMTELENLVIQKPYTNNYEYEVIVQPGENQIVLYKYNPLGDKISFNCEIKANLQEVQIKAVYDLYGYQNDLQEQIQENQMGNSKCNKGNILRGSKLQNMLQKKESDQNEEQIQQQFTVVDLIRFMRETCTPNKRIWDEKEIDVFVYFHQHIDGVIILVQNYESYVYEEYNTLELQNLRLEKEGDDKVNVDYANNTLSFIIQPFEYQILFFETINKNDPYGFRLGFINNFLMLLQKNYGPFWISTTLIFMLYACANLSFYIQEPLNYKVKFGLIPTAFTIVYLMLIGIPILLSFLINFYGGSSTFIDMICIYGYSMCSFIIASFFNIFPFFKFKWSLK